MNKKEFRESYSAMLLQFPQAIGHLICDYLHIETMPLFHKRGNRNRNTMLTEIWDILYTKIWDVPFSGNPIWSNLLCETWCVLSLNKERGVYKFTASIWSDSRWINCPLESRFFHEWEVQNNFLQICCNATSLLLVTSKERFCFSLFPEPYWSISPFAFALPEKVGICAVTLPRNELLRICEHEQNQAVVSKYEDDAETPLVYFLVPQTHQGNILRILRSSHIAFRHPKRESEIIVIYTSLQKWSLAVFQVNFLLQKFAVLKMDHELKVDHPKFGSASLGSGVQVSLDKVWISGDSVLELDLGQFTMKWIENENLVGLAPMNI